MLIEWILALGLSLMSALSAAPLNHQNAPQAYELGSIVEPFSLKNVDDKLWSFDKLKKAKGLVVVFTCNHCPYSVAYEDRLNALDKKYKAKGYPLIAINPNDPEVQPADGFAEMKQRAKEKKFSFPYLFDEGQKIYPKFGATKTPHCYILQKTKEGMKLVYMGAFDDNKDEENVKSRFIEDAIQALLAGKEPSPNSTKAFGCSIKTKK